MARGRHYSRSTYKEVAWQMKITRHKTKSAARTSGTQEGGIEQGAVSDKGTPSRKARNLAFASIEPTFTVNDIDGRAFYTDVLGHPSSSK
jgi:hypothetical protein